ncbi:NUDIX domain-containing protein [Streptomyces sp. NPDC050610]|uniref:NUDIX hydrolase n=1 Tax=Streptomyces sp. NPDC050610 TaxID=3157097 RepID=UPI0034280301
MSAVLPALESVSWLCVRDGRLLAVRTHGREVFYLPGGKLEPGESGPQALSRELSEELGIAAAPEALTEAFVVEDVAHGQEDGRRLHMTCYTGEAAGEPAPGREIAELAWLGVADAGRGAPALWQVIERLAAEGLLA